jgi:hypothetical protein
VLEFVHPNIYVCVHGCMLHEICDQMWCTKLAQSQTFSAVAIKYHEDLTASQ